MLTFLEWGNDLRDCKVRESAGLPDVVKGVTFWGALSNRKPPRKSKKKGQFWSFVHSPQNKTESVIIANQLRRELVRSYFDTMSEIKKMGCFDSLHKKFPVSVEELAPYSNVRLQKLQRKLSLKLAKCFSQL